MAKKSIGIESRRQTKSGRFYEIIPGKPFVSVTTVLQVINKPALVPWAAKMERELCLNVASDSIVCKLPNEIVYELLDYRYELMEALENESTGTQQ